MSWNFHLFVKDCFGTAIRRVPFFKHCCWDEAWQSSLLETTCPSSWQLSSWKIKKKNPNDDNNKMVKKTKNHYLDNHHDLTWLGNTATPHPTHNTHSNPHPSTSGPHPGIGLSQKITTQVHPHPSLEVAHHSPRCYARLCSCRDPLRQVPGSGFRGFWLVGNHRGIFCWGSGTGRVHLLKFNFIPLINTRPSTKEFSKTRRYLLRSININSTL